MIEITIRDHGESRVLRGLGVESIVRREFGRRATVWGDSIVGPKTAGGYPALAQVLDISDISEAVEWVTTVGFGGNPAPHGPWRTREDAARSIRRWMRREGADAGQQIAAHSIRVHGYLTRAQARRADITDVSDDGLTMRQGVYEFLASAPAEEEIYG